MMGREGIRVKDRMVIVKQLHVPIDMWILIDPCNFRFDLENSRILNASYDREKETLTLILFREQ